MAKITEEEFDQIDAERRSVTQFQQALLPLQTELIALRQQMAGMESKIAQSVATAGQGKLELMEAVRDSRDTSSQLPDLAPIQQAIERTTEAISKIEQSQLVEQPKPKSFRIERNRYSNLIESVVPEY